MKPLSVNKAWRGRLFKTPDYKKYERDVSMILPALTVPKGKLQIKIEWGFSSKASDIDNPTKLFVDILQKKYGFNDKNIYKMELTKKEVKKGQEYIVFEIKKFSTV